MFFEVLDDLGHVLFGQDEIGLLEAVNRFVIFVRDDDIDDDELGSGVESDARTGRLLRWSPRGRLRWRLVLRGGK